MANQTTRRIPSPQKRIAPEPKRKILWVAAISTGALSVLACIVLFSPQILAWTASYSRPYPSDTGAFPVTVDPARKTILENEQVNDYLADKHSLYGAALSDSKASFWGAFGFLAESVSDAPWYQGLASVTGRLVTVPPGLRKEQVAAAFGSALGWSAMQQGAFIAPAKGAALPLAEGSFAPGEYLVSLGTTPAAAQALVIDRFSQDILAHYATSTAAIVPLEEALTIASLIQRETITTDGMRLLSGIMWNRIFAGMNLQVDATLQYAKASKSSSGSWWPPVAAKDKYIKSAYNTYQNAGLPPTPIASPSVAAVLAALNPLKTSCLFYFNDKSGGFHCSDTYAEHQKLVTQYYGQ